MPESSEPPDAPVVSVGSVSGSGSGSISGSISGQQMALSAALYAAAFLLTTVLHELAHFVVGGFFGRDPILFQNRVFHHLDVSTTARVLTSLAGPAFSLVQGMGVLALERYFRRRLGSVTRLALAWLAFHGLMNAFGYLFTTAFVPDADLGSAARRLGIPFIGCLVLTAVGFALIRVGARLVYPAFANLLAADAVDDVSARNRGLIRLALLPWPLGVVLVLPASLPFPHWVSALYVVIAGVGAVWFTDFSKAGLAPSRATLISLPASFVVWPWVALLALEVLSIFVMAPGIPWPFGP